MTTNNEEFIVLWEPPVQEPPEFRLYYDDKGKVVCYTGDKSITGDYIVIDALTFAEGRPDVRVIDGKISRAAPNAVVYKLMPSKNGISCAKEDISIVTTLGPTTNWKLTTYEL